MTVTAMTLNTRRGAILPLDQRRRDALAEYAQQAAAEAGVPLQTWVRETWRLQVYEAKDLIRGNASEPVWERILKGQGPHTGWAVAIPILGAVIGQDIAEHFATERQQVAHERARFAAEEARIAALEAHARERRLFGAAALQSRGAAREPGLAPPRVGRRTSQ
jgi:hypothetical protein